MLAVKKTTLLRATNLLGAELPKPDQMSLTSDVPAGRAVGFPKLAARCDIQVLDENWNVVQTITNEDVKPVV